MQGRTCWTPEILVLRKAASDEVAVAIHDGADPAFGKPGFAENAAHRVGRHRDREDISKRSIADDGDAKGQKASARNHPDWTDASDNWF